MSNRFCESTRFDDPFYSSLPHEMKLAREYIHAKCDNAGVWPPNFSLAEFQIGAKVDWQNFRERLEGAGEILVLRNGSWLIKWFIPQQYGKLNTDPGASNAHKSVLKKLKDYGLNYDSRLGVVSIGGPMEPPRQDPGSGQGQEGKGVSGETATPTAAEVIAYGSSPNASVPPDICQIWWDEHEARPRHASGGYTDKFGVLVFDWKAALRGFAGKWRQNEQQRRSNGRPVTPTPTVDYSNGF